MGVVTAVRRVLQRMPPLLVLGITEALLLVYAYPGIMTNDSYDHLAEARAGFITDSHPPAMVVLWQLVELVVRGQFGMLVIQSVAFVAGLYHVMRHAFSDRGAAWATFGVFLFPPVMLPMAVIWKDCGMAGALMLAAAGLLSKRRGPQLAGVLACGIATALRYNAFGATLPLIVLLFEWQPGWHWLRRYALAFAVWFAITVAAFMTNAALTDRQMHFWQSSLAVMDIVGTLHYVDDDLPDAELREVFRGTELKIDTNIHATMRDRFSPNDFQQLVLGDRALWPLPLWGTEPAPEAQRDAVTRAWKHIVFSHPGAYVKYRLATTAEVLHMTGSYPEGVVTKRTIRLERAREMGLPTGQSRLQYRWSRLLGWFSEALPLFVPWIYLVLALILAVVARRQRDVLALLFSGLVIESSLLFLAPSADYRYSHWMITCTCIAIVVVTARRYREGAAKTPQ